MKKSKSFRLSHQALGALQYLSDETGTNETAIVEIALAHYRRAYNSAKLEEVSRVIGKTVPRSMIDKVSIVPISNKKKRKRH